MSTFRDYVTSTAFALTISRRQIECISQLHQFGDTWMLLTTFDALARKGLVERVREKNADEHFSTTARLTEAGHAVVPLLKLAGLYIQYPPRPEPVDLPPIDVAVILKRRPQVQPDAQAPQEPA
ncbi:hypothetical protein [Acidovorax sp. A1169]|uniref:hypothetical protein n=1 Tax=Acidovorax sp. A1169 TaxID=3059524 RepID=UPI002737FBB3|nr:hypothetical protein [Acidovorax sp. A1169]MDP4074228.1 hypothetical protein [Acidovorax sp. A1169]